jgi:hypothetical protein
MVAELTVFRARPTELAFLLSEVDRRSQPRSALQVQRGRMGEHTQAEQRLSLLPATVGSEQKHKARVQLLHLGSLLLKALH